MLKSNDTAVVGLGEESKVHEVETSRIVSSEASHYILVKGTDIEGQSSQDEEEEEENDSQSQTSSLDVGPSTCRASPPGSIPKSGDMEPGIGTGGACLTASRGEIEHEVRKFFRDRKESLGVEDRNKPSKITMATVKKCAVAARDRHDTVVLELGSSGEEEIEQAHKQGSEKENVVIEEGTLELATKDEVVSVVEQSVGSGPSSSQSKEALTDGAAATGVAACTQSQLSRDSVSKGQSESSILATVKQTNDILPLQSTINLSTPAVEEEDDEETKHNLLSCDANVKEKTEASSSSSVTAIDLTAIHTTQEEPKSPEVSPPKQTTAGSMEHELLHSTENSAAAAEIGLIGSDSGGSPSPQAAAAAEVGLIGSDDGGSPSPQAAAAAEVGLIASDSGSSPSPRAAAAAEVESDDGGSPSPRAAEWSGAKEVEFLLTVAPSEAQEQLSLEVEQLERERTRQSRAAASVSNQMYKEAQVHVHLYRIIYELKYM